MKGQYGDLFTHNACLSQKFFNGYLDKNRFPKEKTGEGKEKGRDDTACRHH